MGSRGFSTHGKLSSIKVWTLQGSTNRKPVEFAEKHLITGGS